ncbi:MAG: Flp pilus assembly complex ATPase component TadA [Actinobacteria bacterium]|nr:Flp pilus assembly complex ATPase component TadA [Actinomycetota bacterium]MBS3974228.1 Flp pilus assembly complex ATPase component TadA [Actinomycetota bacterium]
MDYKRERIGDLLIAEGMVTPEQLADALAVQAREGGKLGEIFVRQLVLSEDMIASALASQKGLEHVSLLTYPVDRAVAQLIPERMAKRNRIIPIALSDGELTLAMANPLDIESIDDVELRTGYHVRPVVTAPTQIRHAIDRYIVSADALQDIVDNAQDVDETQFDLQIAEDVPIVRLVNQLVREAVNDGASDIHFEPGEKSMTIRYRVDGVLRKVMELPASVKAGAISRLKIMSEMDIAERRRPQDGRISVRVDDRPVDIRVASLPTPHGEAITLRILNSELSFHSIDDLGLCKSHEEALYRLIKKSYGAVLVSGPTGSGKSTTLYAILHEINDPARKIITIEDPVEYQLAGVTQMAVNARIGLTFSAGLRTILRSDPDVVMVGEVRDPETAEIAIRSALTGHLVLTSIHTNNAPSALTRLTDMGVAPYITSSAIAGVVAQRLVRALCQECKIPLKVPKSRLLAAGFLPEEAASVVLFGPGGCEKCGDSGYKGRLGIFEVMEMHDEMVVAFLDRAPAERLRDLSLAAGMIPLRRDGLNKVVDGVTSLDEVDRVVFE